MSFCHAPELIKNENNYDFMTGHQVLRRLISTYTVSHSPSYWMLCKSGLTRPYNLSVYLAVFGLPVVQNVVYCLVSTINGFN